MHKLQTIAGSPESLEQADGCQFDLIVARDILEHVADIGSVLRGVYHVSKPGGYFHFLTPNGHEDLWGSYVRWKLYGQPSEILLNHVNYFDPSGLQNHLHRLGFETVNYYLDSVKDLRRGRGWKLTDGTASSPTTGIRARETIEKHSSLKSEGLDREAVLNQWWLRPHLRWLAPFYCRTKNITLIRIPGSMRIGHEINGLVRKRQ
jgi:SAM-dependent methyltransferase